MKTYIYKSRKKEELYLYLRDKDDFSVLPEALVKVMGQSPDMVMTLELHPEKKLAREDVSVVMHNLTTQGFHIQMPPSSIHQTSSNLKH
ncbi:protein YcgL [Methylophaga lonarensis MPL]|uniref:Protein YcgL n=1 Tax=Methylophaga lonarensis MPL TaxID=1286106 RepID=M7NVZ2_9GAMM|nr:YcgL domain-containing protein [Methylophaga lonarensis]EMR12943.1 protein YcgL [Methylophaga lonarensis MPL]